MQRVRVTLRGTVQQEVDLDRELTVGRKAPCDIVIADGEVSTRHAKLRPEDGRVLVTDLGSTNGTRIDGGKLTPHQDVVFEAGKPVLIGPAVLELLVADARPETSPGFSATEKTVQIGGGAMQGLLVNMARFKAAQPKLVIAAEHDKRVVPIERMEVLVGREAKQAEIVIQHQSVSSKHAKIRFENGKFLVEDLKSANGTFLDGNPVAVTTPIQSDQALTFGTVDCLFVHKPAESGTGGSLEDPHAEVLCNHAVRMQKATLQQAKDALAEHRKSGASLGQLFVERGIMAPKDWSELYRQRQILVQFDPLVGKRGMSASKIIGIIVGIVGLAALAFFLMKD